MTQRVMQPGFLLMAIAGLVGIWGIPNVPIYTQADAPDLPAVAILGAAFSLCLSLVSVRLLGAIG